VKDWRSDCLEKQSLLVVELCGVLGRLHSIQGLAQSNNNARLNYSAKHVIKAAGNKVQKLSKGMGGKGKTQERKQGTWASCGIRPNEGNLLSVSGKHRGSKTTSDDTHFFQKYRGIPVKRR
jgi:hypothetical protein